MSHSSQGQTNFQKPKQTFYFALQFIYIINQLLYYRLQHDFFILSFLLYFYIWILFKTRIALLQLIGLFSYNEVQLKLEKQDKFLLF